MLTLVKTYADEESTTTEYACDFVAECAGDSLWEDTEGKKVHVTGITVVDYDDGDGGTFKYIYVKHDSNWEIYTDSGFEQAISNALGYDVSFTEQGMQEDNLASME